MSLKVHIDDKVLNGYKINDEVFVKSYDLMVSFELALIEHANRYGRGKHVSVKELDRAGHYVWVINPEEETNNI